MGQAERHVELQRERSDELFQHERAHVSTTDPLVRYLTRWRIQEALRRLDDAVGGMPRDCRVLVMCAGEAVEGTFLLDAGYSDVTTSDLSQVGVDQALARDPRLKGLVLDAEAAHLPDGSYDLVVVQDGLHHLPRPVTGFTEMLRIARTAVLFLEPHDSIAGRRIGRTWEVNEGAVNYVFRWTRRLVEDVSSSYLGPDSFTNLSFAFWHHNIHLEELGRKLGGGERGVLAVRWAKKVADRLLPRSGNQFCGLVVKKTASDGTGSVPV